MKRLFTFCLVAIGIFCFLLNAYHHLEEAGEFPVINPINGDCYTQYLPFLTFAKKSVLAGSLPLWTPYQATGRPFFAEYYVGLLYPINWVVFLLDVPIKRINAPEDIAAMAVFLASPGARNITGQSYNVDGGLVTS